MINFFFSAQSHLFWCRFWFVCWVFFLVDSERGFGLLWEAAFLPGRGRAGSDPPGVPGWPCPPSVRASPQDTEGHFLLAVPRQEKLRGARVKLLSPWQMPESPVPLGAEPWPERPSGRSEPGAPGRRNERLPLPGERAGSGVGVLGTNTRLLRLSEPLPGTALVTALMSNLCFGRSRVQPRAGESQAEEPSRRFQGIPGSSQARKKPVGII